MKLTITFFLLLSLSINAFSQSIVKGHVSDEHRTLPGTNIIIKHSNTGVVSDVEGNYEIEAKQTDTLSISYLGYKTVDILVGNQKKINAVLNGNIELDAVTVVAYRGESFWYQCSLILHAITEANNSASAVITESLYPNPSINGRFNLNLLIPYKSVQIQISNMSGQTIKRMDYKNANKSVEVNLSNSPTGMYIINIIADGKQLPSKKAIIGG